MNSIDLKTSVLSLKAAGCPHSKIMNILLASGKSRLQEALEKGKNPIYIIRNIVETNLIPDFNNDNIGCVFFEDGSKKCVKEEFAVNKDSTTTSSTGPVATGKENITPKSQGYSNGETSYTDLIELPKGKDLTPELIMEFHGLKKSDWEVVSYKSNLWQSQTKDNGKTNLYQSKLTVKPIAASEITLERLQEVMEAYDAGELVKKQKPRIIEAKKGNYVLEIDLADLHFGLCGHSYECGESYNIDICRNVVMSALAHIEKDVKSFHGNISKIVLTSLGDFIHVDNSKQTTTAGTFQQIDGSFYNLTDEAFMLLEEILSVIESWGYPTEFVYVPGNHDNNSGYIIATGVARTLKAKGSKIEFDVTPDPIKCRQYGVHAACYHHGNANRKNLGVAFSMFKEIYGKTQYHRVVVGHLHHYEAIPAGDTLINYVPSLTASSYWEHSQLYNSHKGLQYTFYDTYSGNRRECFYIPEEKMYN